MKLPNCTRIAGEKTVADWRAKKDRLTVNPDPAAWTDAFENYFKARLESRYFEPIRAIEKMEKHAGEGFAIVALHCSLIEFLAALLEGKTYRYWRKGDPPLNRELEYDASRDMFVGFLERNEPFKSMFYKDETAEDFYSSIRCGLLHEARTKGHWKIRVRKSATQAIDVDGKVVYRNKMQAAFNQFVEWYGQQLPTNAELQRAFIQKFDGLCDE